MPGQRTQTTVSFNSMQQIQTVANDFVTIVINHTQDLQLSLDDTIAYLSCSGNLCEQFRVLCDEFEFNETEHFSQLSSQHRQIAFDLATQTIQLHVNALHNCR